MKLNIDKTQLWSMHKTNGLNKALKFTIRAIRKIAHYQIIKTKSKDY